MTEFKDFERELRRQSVPRFFFKEEKIRGVIRVLKLLDGTEYSITISHLVDVLEWFIEQFCYQDIEVNYDKLSKWGSVCMINKIEIKPLSKEGKRLIDGVTDTWEHDVLSYLEDYKSYDDLTEKETINSLKSKRKPISGRIRQNVLMRDNYTCQICGATVKDGAKLEIDHIIPFSKGGTNHENNLQVLCRQCNREKHNRNDLLHDQLKLQELKR